MKTIVIISQKGGVGKTTLAINLAAAALRSGLSSIIADTDPQQSAYNWYKDRTQDQPLPYVLSSYPDNLPGYIEAARQEGADYFFVDTSPNSSEQTLRVARHADLILVPCSPSFMDLRALEPTANIVRLAAKPAQAVLTLCPPRGSEPNGAEEALQLLGFSTIANRIGHRTATRRAHAANMSIFEYEPAGKAAAEFSALFKAIARDFYRDEQLEKKQARKKEAANV